MKLVRYQFVFYMAPGYVGKLVNFSYQILLQIYGIYCFIFVWNFIVFHLKQRSILINKILDCIILKCYNYVRIVTCYTIRSTMFQMLE